MTKSMSAHYTMLFVSIITSVLLVFMGLLLIVVIIVITYSITTGIQMDYVNIGILKAVGITQGQLRLILVLQYIAAEIVGMAAGLAGSVWLIKSFGTIFQPIMAVVITTRIAWAQSFFWIAVILAGTGILLFVLTAKAAKITPMRALSQGKDEIYFSSRLNVAVSPKHLYTTLALRQITSEGRRYVGTVVIVAILVFFMMTIQILGGIVDSESARESMGEIVSDVEIQLQTKVDEHEFQNIEQTIEEITPIQKKCYTNTTYMSLNGEEIYCFIYQNPGDMQMTKGRAPIYDNEIAITEITAEEVGIKMGDTVTVACGSNREEYLVSGIYQGLNDAGLNFSIGFQGAQKLGISSMGYGAYKLSEPEKAVQVQERLNEVYPEILKVQTSGDASMDKTYEAAIQAMQLIVNVFSVLFGTDCGYHVLPQNVFAGKNGSRHFKGNGTDIHTASVVVWTALFNACGIGSSAGSDLLCSFVGKASDCNIKANGDYTFNHFTAPGFGAVSDRTYLCQLLFICVFGIPRDKKAFRYCTNCGVEMRFSILILPKVCYIIL